MTDQKLPASHLSGLQTNVGRPLTVLLPTLYRYMDKQFVEEFSACGSIQLSSFANFSKHRDEARGDRSEGTAMHFLRDPNNNRSLGVFTKSGSSAYILSATSGTSPRISEAFGSACIEIIEPIGFCAEIANEIPGCTSAMVGHCLYADDRILTTFGKAPTRDDLKREEARGNLSMEKIAKQSGAMSGLKQYFLKTRDHEWQSEYRFVWETNKQVDKPLVITAPNLRKYCS